MQTTRAPMAPMKALLQRVKRASVTCKEGGSSETGPGLLIFLGVESVDLGNHSEKITERLARKSARLRIFEDDDGKMNRSLLDTGGEALVISQFTLCADTRKGNRPSYKEAAPPEEALRLYELFCEQLETLLPGRVRRGFFRCDMQVSLVNDGPVTILLEA